MIFFLIKTDFLTFWHMLKIIRKEYVLISMTIKWYKLQVVWSRSLKKVQETNRRWSTCHHSIHVTHHWSGVTLERKHAQCSSKLHLHIRGQKQKVPTPNTYIVNTHVQ